jgi:lysophospholipase L1-like esterase
MKKIYFSAMLLLGAINVFSQIKILPVGESTTESAPGYRKKLYDLVKAQGASVDMVGPKNDGATTYDGDHAGYSGSPADAVQLKVESFYATIPADAVLIWEGTNDCGWASSNGDTTSVGKLVDKVLELYPSAQVFVASIPPMSYNAYESASDGRLPGVGQKNGVIFNQNLPTLVANRVKAGKKIHHVDATSLTLADVSSDGIHPNQQGYDKMGTLFFEALKRTVLDNQKPTAPTNLQSSNANNNSFTLSWTASTDNIAVTGYDIFKDDILYSSINAASITIEDLGAGQTYKFKVQAKDGVGNISDISTELVVTMSGTKETIPPSIPTYLNVTDLTATNFVLNWTKSTDNDMVLEYDVYKDGMLYGTTKSSDNTILVANLIPSSTCVMTVKAKDRTGNTSSLSTMLSVTTLLPPTKYEAEDAALSGGSMKANDHTGNSGSGFVAGIEVVGASATFTVSVKTAGQYNVILAYGNSMGNTRTVSIYVNGTRIKQTELASLQNWDSWSTQKEVLTLKAGGNTVAYKYDNGDLGFVNLDYIDVQSATVTNVSEIEEGLISIYPNPVQNHSVNIDFTQLTSENLTMSLYNANGTKVFTTVLNSTAVSQIQLPSNLSSGIYILEARGNSLQYHRKIVIQ